MPTETPWAQQAVEYNAREDRRMLARLPIQAGVDGGPGGSGGDLKVTPVSALTVAVAAGDAWIAGSHAGVVRQGLYNAALAAAENVTATAAHATLPRIDQVVLRIRDTVPAPAAAGDAENSGKIEIVAGTATAGATLNNRTGVAALPASSLRLADILVPAAFAGPFVQNTHIRDRRTWAAGAFNLITRTANAAAGSDYTTTNAALTLMDATNLQPRIELSGVPTRVGIMGRHLNSGANFNSYNIFVDGVTFEGTVTAFGSEAFTAGQERILDMHTVFTPAAGSHLIGPAWAVTAGTGTLRAQAVAPFKFYVEEILRPNASNSGA